MKLKLIRLEVRRKMVKRKSVRNTIILCILTVVIVMVSAVALVNVIGDELTQSARESLEDLADQQQVAINRQLASMTENLMGAADTIAILGENEDQVLEYIYSRQEVLGFELAMISDEDGNTFVTTGKDINIAGYEYFQMAIVGETYATEVHKSNETDKLVITVSAPIVKEGKIEGVLALEYSADYLRALLANLTDESGENFILNRAGEIIISTDLSMTDTDYLGNTNYLANAKYKEEATFNAVVNDFVSGQSGGVSYTNNDSEKFGEYRTIVINDWILFFEVSEDELTENIARLTLIVGAVSAVIIVLGAATMLYVVLTKNKYYKQLEKKAYYDELTYSPNIEKLKLHMEQVLNDRPSDRYGIVKIDVANFKAINEIYGYDVGNKVLCAIANTGATVKENYFLQARTGVDEFMFFCEGAHVYELDESKDGFQAYFKTLVPELKEHNFFFRYGRYYIKRDETDVNSIISKVNLAHSIAKTKSTREVWNYDEKYAQKALRDAEIANKMQNALANEEFKMYLQPKVDMVSGEVTGAEALVRWHEAGGGMISPGEFIPLFEENGFIIELDRYMLKSVCRLIKFWKDNHQDIVPISVNFSRLDFHNIYFVEELKRIVGSYQVEPRYVEIEVTETVVSDNAEEMKVVINQLKSAGFRVSIDDFGSGYSSLGMLKNFNVDTLKLDRSFFVEIEDKLEYEKANLVVASIVDLAQKLGMYTVAEGIETGEQIGSLKSINCNAVQGYYYSKAVPAEEFEKIVEDYKCE